MRRVLICAWLSLGSTLAHAQSPTPTTGSICGYVQNERGAPAAHTKIIAFYLGGYGGPIPLTVTDEAGHYCATNLMLGEYEMTADDADKGYPMLMNSLYAPYAPERAIKLTPESPHGHLNWQIPYKAGFLHLSIRDAQTGTLLKFMSVCLIQRSDEERRMQVDTGSERVLLIPSNQDIYLRVSWPGYESWPEDGSKGKLLNLFPGQDTTLQVTLRPK